MNHFVVSARKYRPSTFEEVVGQKAVTSTLSNAIKNNHLAQALLFTGPRGVGKTSCARILAKMVNEIYSGEVDDFAFNIFELDAASNNSVDDIRALNDSVRVPPQTGKYKVYIIDEVHMLSSQAFNAFLKTLEEPPKHAIFILATTEKHKIIPTILSRCQVFDFKRITVQDIKEHLIDIAKKEGITAEEEALQIIAQKSDGAMRDALSTYDRVVSYCGTHLTREAVAENLNVLDFETFIKTTDFIISNDIPNVLVYFNDVLAKGYDGQHFISGLAGHFRNLLICKNPQTLSLLDVGDNTKEVYKKQAEKLSSSELLLFIDETNTCDFNYKLSQNKLLHVELCLMKLASHNIDSEKKKTKLKIAPASKITSVEIEDKEVVKEHKPVNPPKTEPRQTIEPSTSVNDIVNSTVEKSEVQKPKIELPKKKNGLSIKAIQYKKEHIQKHSNTTENKIELNEEYTLEDLKSAWLKYAEIIDKKGQKILASTLLSDLPKLKDNTVIVNMPNESMKVSLEQSRSKILGFLHNSLQNTSIQLKILVTQAEEKKYIHTKEEKYQHFLEVNPEIEQLKKALDLDI
jgi:DNA polymerase-3 subunit gamma/tau